MAEVTNPGSVTVGQGYYNADGTNTIKFTSPVTKTLTEAAVDLSHKNDIVLTLDSEGTSSFVLNGSDKTLTGYKKTRKLDSPSVYVDPSKKYILGTEPTVINASVESQNPGGTYELKYLTLNGSVNYDETTGKLSGFSSSNYATSSSGITFGNSFDLIFNVTISEENLEQTLFYGKEDRGLYLSGGKICAWFGSNISGTTSVTSGTTYWIRLIWNGTTYTTYSLVDDGTYTLKTLPELSSWTQEFTYSSSSNIFAPGYWVGYHSQASSQYARSTFNMGKAQITTNGVTYRYADGDAEPGSVSFTKGWIYSDGITYQNKNTDPLSVSTLTGNATGTVTYKNKLQLGYEPSSDVSVPYIQEGLTLYAYDMNTDIYLDNTKSKILGTTALSDSWKDSPYTIQKGIPADYKQYKIVGNGTTIENGIASGFSESSYIQFIESPFTSTDPDSFKMFFEVTTGDATHSYQEIIAQNNCILLRKSDTTSWNIAVYNGSSWDTTHFGTYAYNTKYYIRVIYFKNTTTWNGYSYTGGYTYAEVSTDNSSWTRTYRTNKPNFASTEPIYLGTNGLNEWWSGSINLNNSRIEFNDEVTFPLNPTNGSITVSKGYRYINETNGSFFIQTNTTKTLEQLVVGDKTEQMGLYLVIKTDLSTDFVLSSTAPTTDISYAEKVVDVYLDRTLSYIYGTTADPRVKFTINATPNTANVNMVDLVPSSPVQVSGTGTATILVDPSNNLINYGVSAEGYTTKSGTVTATADDTLDVVLEVEAPAERTEPTLPTDTFYAWTQPDSPTATAWYTLTETPVSNEWMYVANAGNPHSLPVSQSSGVADQTLEQIGGTIDGTTLTAQGLTFERNSSYDGEFYLCRTWVNESNTQGYLTKNETPVSGDVVYHWNSLTGAVTNSGTVGTEWTYDSSSGKLTSSDNTLTAMNYQWIKTSIL